MIFLIYTILVILQQYNGMTTVVQDPCPSTIQKRTIVADMCNSSSATEENIFGNDKIDSVLLRIMIQQDNCVCRVTIDNQIKPISIGLRKYDGISSSAPEKVKCGLAVDINHIPDRPTGNKTAPIECRNNVEFRSLQLLQNGTLQFKSRIIEGSFTRGYCMQIQRDSSTNHSQVLRIVCDASTITQRTTHQTITSNQTTDISTATFPQTTASVTASTVITTITTDSPLDASKKFENISMTTDPTTGLEQTTYIAIGAGSCVALILLVILVVICLRRKSSQKAGTNGNVNKSYQQEESDDKLPDNVLYVPAEEFDITGDKYSTADVDTAISSNKRLSVEGNYSIVDEDITNFSNNRLSMEGNYSTVDMDTPRSSNTRLSMKGNYSTVDDDMPKSSNELLSVEGNYSTVEEGIPKSTNNRLSTEGNYSKVELDEHLDTNCSLPENSELNQTKGKQRPAIKPKPKSFCINSEENRSSDQKIKHITPPNGSDNIYAVVDKSNKNVPTTNGSKRAVACQPDQTYAVVDKARKRKSSPDETNK